MKRQYMLALSSAALLVAPTAGIAAQHAQHRLPAPRSSVADWSRGARLFEGLGKFHRPIRTRSPEAQLYFDQGMRFLWAFNHDEATRSFAKAAQLDPHCGACFWGVALTVGPNYNMPVMSQARARAGAEALAKARANAAAARPVDRALIAAVAKRYSGAAALDPSTSGPLLASYVAAMRDVSARFPDDLDVRTLFAEALMNTNPWKLWNGDGTPGAGTPEIVRTLQSVLAKDPSHPGANHYWVHAIEASPDPQQGLAAAVALTGMMPSAGHLEHMPAHIMQRVGRYEEAAEANRKGAAADEAYLRLTAAPDYYPMYLIHNYQFLAFAAAAQGRAGETIAALRKARSFASDAMLLAMPGIDRSIGYLYDGLARFGMWPELLKEPVPNPQLGGLTIAFHQARASAFAATGRLVEAKAEAAHAAKLAVSVPRDATQGLNSARAIYAIGQLRCEARIALAEAQPAIAIAMLRRAEIAEDALLYNEPDDVFFPARHLLGSALLEAGFPAEAEATYRNDLKRHPHNGWALAGLANALTAQGKSAEAAAARRALAVTWSRADTAATGSSY